MEEGLCWCEYMDKDGERSHLLAALCNCDAVDDAFDRFISHKSIQDGQVAEIFGLIEDRLRIPWPGGAKKFKVDVAATIILVPTLIILGSFNVFCTVISYSVILPFIIYLCHSLIRKKHRLRCLKNEELPSELEKPRVSHFYFFWLITSVLILLIIYYIEVIGSLEISSSENFCFLFLLVSSCTCFYIVIAKGKLGIRTVKDNGTNETGTSKLCTLCSTSVPGTASHCKLCGVCYIFRDHHCLWLNTCISRNNDRWFFIGLVLAFNCIVYGANLSFTSICHPKIVKILYMDVYYPAQCPNAYFDFSTSVTFSAGWYAIALAVCIVGVVMQQIISILQGRRTTRLNDKSHIWQNFISRWLKFWCRW